MNATTRLICSLCLLIGIASLITLHLSGCCTDCDEIPACPSCPSQPTIIELHSGTDGHGNLGVCQTDVDSLTRVSTNQCDGGQSVFALVWGGASDCVCNRDDQLKSDESIAISATCNTAYSAVFTRTFGLPAGATNIKLDLAVAADDGVEVFLNDLPLGTVDLTESSESGIAPAFVVYRQSLFVAGTNTLRFDVRNTGVAIWDAPLDTNRDQDCCWLEYSGTVSYEK